jgi:integrase
MYNLLEKTEENASIICDYIIAEQNEINIKESTKEGKIKVLTDLLKFLNYKNLKIVRKRDILSYLNKYRKNEEDDSTHRWIGTWNNRHMILLQFFRWLNDSDNQDLKNRKIPQCMHGVKRLTRKEISRYKPSDLWTVRECEIFLKHCPSKRDRAFLSMAPDTSCRPHELLNLKIEDIQFRISTDGLKQYAETTINGKTGQRTVLVC